MVNVFTKVQPWVFQILRSIKKELKMEHLSKSHAFHKAHFGNRPLNRLTNEEISTAYEKELLQGNEELAEWVINRWVFRHGDIYKHFAERLSEINPEFQEIKNLDDTASEKVVAGAPEAFGFLPVYLFAMLNGVVLSPYVIERLRLGAEKEKREEEKPIDSELNLHELLEKQKNEIIRLEKKYEEKLAGALKKHAIDVEALKKQVRALQLKRNQ